MIPAGFFLIISLIVLVVSVRLNGGRFIYTIDDAYIHLALSENIIRGHYGVNMHELSAPSSSIIWPFLLAPFMNFSWGEYVPLWINIAACLLTIIIVCTTLEKALSQENIPHSTTRLITILAGCLFPLIVNLTGMAFNGMEHALQVLSAVAVVAAFVREYYGAPFPFWGVLAIIAGPFIRYENGALAALAIVFLFLRGSRVAAVTAFFVIAIGVTAFSLFIYSLDLGFLPTSVQAKSHLHGRGVFPLSVLRSFGSNLLQRQGPLLFGAVLLILAKLKQKDVRHIVLIVGGAVLAHFAIADIMGRRYTAYLSAMMLFTIVFLYRQQIVKLIQGAPVAKVTVSVVLAGISAALLIFETARTPVASNNIYEQQYQMHRLAKLYNKPVAINDLGLVSYGNEQYVLDLWGLASLKALNTRRNATSNDWPDMLCRDKNVGLVMIYDDWFAAKPAHWKKVGDISLSRRRVTPAGETVAFYATNPDAQSEIMPVLHRFKTMLPERVKMNIYE